jgi:hypothetical protein
VHPQLKLLDTMADRKRGASKKAGSETPPKKATPSLKSIIKGAAARPACWRQEEDSENVEKVPSFSFSFMPDAKTLGGTIPAPREARNEKIRKHGGGLVAAPPVKPATEASKELREAYAVLFHHSRTEEQTGDSQSAVKRLQECLRDGEISDDSLRITNNIQNILNSLRAGVPEDGLAARTTMFAWYVSHLPSHFSTLPHKH